MDHGFSSPLRGSFPDDSPIKIESKASEQRTPITPPSLCALRLFDSPHTPKSLLERAGTNSPRFTENAKPTVSRLRRNLIKHRGTESEPRNGIRTRYPVCAANVNPFTPDGRGTAISVKRGRSSRWVTLACFLWIEIFSSLVGKRRTSDSLWLYVHSIHLTTPITFQVFQLVFSCSEHLLFANSNFVVLQWRLLVPENTVSNISLSNTIFQFGTRPKTTPLLDIFTMNTVIENQLLLNEKFLK